MKNKDKISNNSKILICTGIYPPDSGGPATYSKLLFEELPKKGIDVEVLSFGKVRHLPKLLRHFAYFIETLKKSERIDLIYAQDPVSVGLPSLLASKIAGKKFVLKMVGDYAWEQQQQRKGVDFVTLENFQNKKFDFVTEVRKKIERFVGKKADKIVVPSNYLKKIVTMWGVDEDKIKVIYNAFAPVNLIENKEQLRNEFGFEETTISSVARLVPWKGFEMLIEIIKDLPNVKLFIADDGPDRNKLNRKIRDLNLEDRIKLLGRLERKEVLKRIKASDLFVLNTGYEGLSHLLLETMAVGTPIITTNIGGNPELVENNKEGLLVEYNNKEEIKEAILKLLNDSQLADLLVKNSKEKVKKFNKDKMLDEISEFLKNQK